MRRSFVCVLIVLIVAVGCKRGDRAAPPASAPAAAQPPAVAAAAPPAVAAAPPAVAEAPAEEAPAAEVAGPVLFESEEALKAGVISAAWYGDEHVERLMQAAFSAEQLERCCAGLKVEGLVPHDLARRVYTQLCGAPLRAASSAVSYDELIYEYTQEKGGWCDMKPRVVGELIGGSRVGPGAQRYKLYVALVLCDTEDACPCDEEEGCEEPPEQCSFTLYAAASMDVLKVAGGWGVIFADPNMSEGALTALAGRYDASTWCSMTGDAYQEMMDRDGVASDE